MRSVEARLPEIRHGVERVHPLTEIEDGGSGGAVLVVVVVGGGGWED